ncbi:geranylgeranyl transferase type-1 subunit beta-like [Bidens hawaiensis]|uniref:geranylgeranyl transferase type-1 subunit beta-like n=1 Tax=Bidens hawaiensis TaxID=980011 RepID=UPI00404AF7D1
MADDGDLPYTSPSEPVPVDQLFDRERHIRYLEMNYQILPSPYEGQEIIHLTLAYFIISGLHILQALDRIDREAVIDWVLSLQAHPKNEDDLNNGQFYGFHGSKSSQFHSVDDEVSVPNNSHLASTYCALAILKIVDYDFSLIDSGSISMSMKHLQQSDGSFMPIHTGAETDLRFVYCAAVISSLLDNWSGIDKEKAKNYILSCQSYDGGFGLIPGQESHGGATYCAVASLRLMGFIEDDIVSKSTSSCIIDVPMLLEWCLQRQAVDGGFQGRPNKVSDTCYAFWVGGVLKILGANKFMNEKTLREFLLTCQSEYGGFSKFPRQFPDLYHSYYGFTAFSMLQETGLNSLNIELGISTIQHTMI